jgi:hypothetical protein
MVLALISLAVGIALLLMGLGKIGHIGDIASTVSIGVSLGLLLFALSHGAFGRRRRSSPRRSVPEEKVGA